VGFAIFTTRLGEEDAREETALSNGGKNRQIRTVSALFHDQLIASKAEVVDHLRNRLLKRM
jgi:hypothetical protein